MSTDVKALLERVKNLKEFTIQRKVPEDFTLYGKIPYDLKIDRNSILTIKLMAVDKEEAERRVSEFITGMNDDD